jgi:hypothetical protein
MEYWIIALLAWNIIISLILYRKSKEQSALTGLVLEMDDACKSTFKSLINAVNIQTRFMNKIIGDNDFEPENKRVH